MTDEKNKLIEENKNKLNDTEIIETDWIWNEEKKLIVMMMKIMMISGIWSIKIRDWVIF